MSYLSTHIDKELGDEVSFTLHSQRLIHVLGMINIEEISRSYEPLYVFFQKLRQQWKFHLYSVWLFTFSDLKTIVIPSTVFALVNGIALSLEHSGTHSSDFQLPSPGQILGKTPLVVFWVWINLLPFAIDNQRQPESIEEDSLNKPWRTMPSQRLSQQAAKRLMLTLYAIAIVVSFLLDNLGQCLSLIALGYWYNDLRGGDVSCLVRNLINGFGFICFSSGAMQVAIGGGPLGWAGLNEDSSPSAIQLLGWWFAVIAGIVLTTVQTQDMYDQRGDASRNRKTVPLVMGDGPARWSIAIPMVVWCYAVPWLWSSSALGYVAPVSLGLTVAVRTLRVRTEEGDKTTFLIWNLWMVAVYLLPLIKALEKCIW
jgi:4-hydroxybenzoate polyprenyltransferase